MKNKILFFYTIIYVFLGLFALNFSYVEGDDAATVMYHIMGRESEFQPPYSSYHSMFDWVLSMLNENSEYTIRTFGILISFLGGLVSLYLLTFICFIKNGNNHKNSFYALLLLPFLIPEILFSSLLINPSMIAISLLLLSHICLLRYQIQEKLWWLVLSVILFGLGTSFRWSCGFYLFILFGEVILFHKSSVKDAFLNFSSIRTIVLFLGYIISVLCFIYISGYSPSDIIDTFSEGSSYMENNGFSVRSYGAVAMSFITPSLLLLVLLGLYYDLKSKHYKSAMLLIMGLFPYLIIGLYPSYKYMVTLVVPIVLLSISGMKMLNYKSGKAIVLSLVFLPWIIGVQVTSNSSWGPGFELKNKVGNDTEINANFNPDNSIKVKAVDVGFKSGMAMPTLEGPRPLFGFLYCLAKDWKTWAQDVEDNRILAVNYAIDNELDILQDVPHSYLTTKLVGMGYETEHSYRRKIGTTLVREFTKHHDTIIVNVLIPKQDVFKIDKIEMLKLNKSQIVIYSLYTNIISKMKINYQDNFDLKSANWGVLTIK